MIEDNFLEEEQQTEETGSESPEKVKLGDQEFTQDELLQKVGLADKVSQLESKYNTKLDSVWPEYGRSQNKIRELEQKISQMETQKSTTGDIDPQTAQQAIEAARKLGLLTKEDGVMTKADFREAYMQERETDRLLGELEGLERSIDGTDGRPKFDKIAVLEYMRETGIKNPEKAYKDMFEKPLDIWKAKQLTGSRGQGMYTTTQTNVNKQPSEVKPTKANLNELVSEALAGNI